MARWWSRVAAVEMNSVQMVFGTEREMVVHHNAVVVFRVDFVNQLSAFFNGGVGFAQVKQVDRAFGKQTVDGFCLAGEEVGESNGYCFHY